MCVCLPFVELGMGYDALLNELIVQQSHVLSGFLAALQCALQTHAHKHKQQRGLIHLNHTLHCLLHTQTDTNAKRLTVLTNNHIADIQS